MLSRSRRVSIAAQTGVRLKWAMCGLSSPALGIGLGSAPGLGLGAGLGLAAGLASGLGPALGLQGWDQGEGQGQGSGSSRRLIAYGEGARPSGVRVLPLVSELCQLEARLGRV